MTNSKVFIILEAGVNHNGELKKAIKLIDIAKKAGADAVKFQTWKTNELLTKKAKTAKYQKKYTSINNQHELVKKLELSNEDFLLIYNHCKRKKIKFLSTADDIPSAKFLSKYQNIFKIGSGEIDNVPFLRFIGSLKKKIILSTGNSTFQDIKLALKILTKSGTKMKDIALLHCNSAYPTPIKDANVNCITLFKKHFTINVGLSDHTMGYESAISAVALGAKIIEKHFTLNKKLKGPDHHMSLDPQEAKEFVSLIRNTTNCLGNGLKRITNSEKENKKFVRKSIVAKKIILKGEKFTKKNLTTKRPGLGVSPIKWDKIIGKKSKKNYEEDDFIEF